MPTIDYNVSVYKDRTIFTNNKNQYHCEEGPAVQYFNGDREWWINGKLHRVNGPAVESISGYKAWYLNGLFHRTDGPAVERANGEKLWYLNGKNVTEDDFKRLISNDTLEDKIIEIDGRKYKLMRVEE